MCERALHSAIVSLREQTAERVRPLVVTANTAMVTQRPRADFARVRRQPRTAARNSVSSFFMSTSVSRLT